MGINGSTKKNASGGLTDKEIVILMTASNKSEQQIRDDYADFKKECPSGKMDKKKFTKLTQKIVGNEFKIHGADFINNVFTVFDTNHDDTLDYSEFVLAIAALDRKDLDNTLNLAFDMIDISADGQVTFDELVGFFDAAVKLLDVGSKKDGINSKLIATYVFGELGVDEEQKLSKQQFIDGCKKSSDLREIFATS